MGNLLWSTLDNPIESSKRLAAATMAFCSYLRTCDKAELAQMLVPEMYELITQWNHLSEQRRGELAGYTLGKYGTEILLPIAAAKGVHYAQVYHDIRKAEKLCTLETLASSPENKKALAQTAAKWNNQRKAWFENVRLEIDQQTKHIPGSWNYKEGKSILTHSNPQKLLKEHAGKGQKIKGMPGEFDYRERVNFGEVIGYHIDEKTKEKTLTTVGTIRYSKRGAHIVPARPEK